MFLCSKYSLHCSREKLRNRNNSQEFIFFLSPNPFSIGPRTGCNQSMYRVQTVFRRMRKYIVRLASKLNLFLTTVLADASRNCHACQHALLPNNYPQPLIVIALAVSVALVSKKVFKAELSLKLIQSNQCLFLLRIRCPTLPFVEHVTRGPFRWITTNKCKASFPPCVCHDF